VTAKKLNDPSDSLRILQVFAKGIIPVMVDPLGDAIQFIHPTVVVDARMLKKRVELDARRVSLLIGLGPGFEASKNCHAVIETNRGHHLGRVYWQGTAENDTGLPDSIEKHSAERVLRAPVAGIIEPLAQIGDHVEAQQPVVAVSGQTVTAPFKGVLRGLLHEGLEVHQGEKIGDVDPRNDPVFCTLVSDKSLAIGGAVLEAILSRAELRPLLWK
jgi:xanthine dehydrogenase accessory factor